MEQIDTYARGIEQYKKPINKYPVNFYKKIVIDSDATARVKQEAKDKGLNPDAVPPVEKEVVYARIHQIGARSDNYDGQVTDEIAMNYMEELEQFMNGTSHNAGIPLSDWAGIPEEMKLILQMNGVYTVEQFINLPTSLYGKIAPDLGRFIVEAKRFLGNMNTEAKQQEDAAKEQRIAELEAKLEKLMSEQDKGKRR